ncbi:MAG: hypothetical protein GY785_20010 [Gammaproteobacteria bacterium]|nr:hypothetical protein [Gammaproteobacteria bacterium]
MMRVDRVTPVAGSGQTEFNASWQLINTNSDDALRYRQRFSLALPTAGIAEELLLADTTGLKLKARHLIFDALENSAPERAQLSNAGNDGVRLILPLARIIHSIRFAGAASSGGKTTQLFRVDGDVIADDPVTSYQNPLPRRTTNPGTPGNPKIDVELSSQSGHGSDTQIHTEALGVVVIDNGLGGLPGGELGLIDREVIIRLSDTDPLNADHISKVNLSTGPENLRVMVRLPVLNAEAIALPLVFKLNQQVDCGRALRDQLADLIRRLKEKLTSEPTSTGVPTLPDPLLFELDIESDAPCNFEISDFTIDYQLLRHSFPNGESKQVLRFPGDRLGRQQLTLSLPAGSTLVEGEIRINGNPAEGAAGPLPTAVGALEAAADNHGLRTDARHGWSSPLDLSNAVLIRGIDLLMSPLQTGVQLQLELVASIDGLPDGERLGLANGNLGAPGRTRWQRFTFDQNLLLQPDRYWLVLSSREGAAVWYTRPATGSRVLRTSSEEDGAIAEERAGIANWLAAGGPASAQQKVPEIRLNGQLLDANAEGRELVYDLLPGLASVSGPSGTLLFQDLEVFNNGPKPLTLYPPRIVFEMATSG